MSAEHERPEAPRRPHTAMEAHECKRRAEDEDLSAAERQVWATLAVAAELHIIRKKLSRG